MFSINRGVSISLLRECKFMLTSKILLIGGYTRIMVLNNLLARVKREDGISYTCTWILFVF